MGQTNPLVPQNAYTQAILKELTAVPYDPKHHNGMRNPYSRKKITCKEDYDEYVREYIYYRLCDEYLQKKYDLRLSLQTEYLSSQYESELALQAHQIETQYQSKINELSRQFKEKAAAQIKQWIFLGISFALVFSYIFFWYIPNKESSTYAEGSSEGYRQGYVTGYAEARLDNSGSYYKNSHTSGGATVPSSEVSTEQTVYVSHSGHKIHLYSDCSGMKYYDEMSYGEACTSGYAHCQKCF